MLSTSQTMKAATQAARTLTAREQEVSRLYRMGEAVAAEYAAVRQEAAAARQWLAAIKAATTN